MKFNRRNFLSTTIASAVVGVIGSPVLASAEVLNTLVEPNADKPDGLNPPGIRTAGIKMVPVVDGKYKVWTKRMGKGPVKVLILHGGPGFSHEYLEALESFLPEAGIEMYYYDQLGCNNSDQPDDPSLWTIERYVTEIEEVRRGLNLNHFVLYGHSFGGVLAMEYALKYPQYLRALVISNMAASVKSCLTRSASIKQQLPPVLLAKLDALEANHDYDSPEYQRIMMEELYPKMLCRTKPWPESFTRCLRHANLKIYEQIQGKSEFVVTGNMKDWDLWGRLHEIKTKTLTIGAEYDEMDPRDMEKMAQLMPNASSFICKNGSHLCMYDDQIAYFDGLLKFLRQV